MLQQLLVADMYVRHCRRYATQVQIFVNKNAFSNFLDSLLYLNLYLSCLKNVNFICPQRSKTQLNSKRSRISFCCLFTCVAPLFGLQQTSITAAATLTI